MYIYIIDLYMLYIYIWDWGGESLGLGFGGDFVVCTYMCVVHCKKWTGDGP